jgi:hypothetical protein
MEKDLIRQEERAHARFAPSGSMAWLFCAFSAYHIGDYKADRKNEDNTAAITGTLMHELAELCFRYKECLGDEEKEEELADYTNRIRTITGTLGEEKTEQVRNYCRFVMEEGKGHEILVEQRVSMEKYHIDCWGTADVVIYNEENELLKIIDLKTGWNSDEPDSPQLALYALGAMDTLFSNKKITNVETIIYQTTEREPIKRKTWSMDKIKEFIDLVRDANERNKEVDKLSENEAQELASPLPTRCQYCPKRVFCEAVKKACMGYIEALMAGNPHAEEFSIAIQWMPFITKQEEAFKDKALDFYKAEGGIPGCKIKPGGYYQRMPSDEESQRKIINVLVNMGYKKEDICTEKTKGKTEMFKVIGDDKEAIKAINRYMNYVNVKEKVVAE